MTFALSVSMEQPITTTEHEELEKAFWTSVHELQDAMFAKCLWLPGLSDVALNRLEFETKCAWCIGHVGLPGEISWIEDPNQLELL